MLAKWIGAKEEEISYTCAGINHQAFYTQFLVNGRDAYPAIRKAVTERPEVYNEEIVRNEMFWPSAITSPNPPATTANTTRGSASAPT